MHVIFSIAAFQKRMNSLYYKNYNIYIHFIHKVQEAYEKVSDTTGTEWHVQQEWFLFHIYNDKNEGGFLGEAYLFPPKNRLF